MEAGNSTILVESSDVGYEEELVKVGALDHVEKKINKLLETTKPVCESLLNTFESLYKKPDSAEAEFGLSFTGEGNLFFVKASGEATLKITVKWDFSKK